MSERRFGYPRSDIERVMRHYGVSYAEAVKGLREGYYVLPPRGTALTSSKTFQEPVLGKCEYTSFYLVNETYGGYTATCERGRISNDFVPSQNVIDLAAKANMPIHLAGSAWKEVGALGWGQLVKPDEARILVQKLKSKSTKTHQSDQYKTPDEIVESFIKGVRG